MKNSKNAEVRTSFAAFRYRLGGNILQIRIYREGSTLIYERDFIEPDGTLFTLVRPITDAEAARTSVVEDPYYDCLRCEMDVVLRKLCHLLSKGNE